MPREQGPLGGDASSPRGDVSGPGEIAKPPGGGSLGRGVELSKPGIAGGASEGKYGFGFSAAGRAGDRPSENPIMQASTGGDSPPPPKESGTPPDQGSPEERTTVPKKGDVFVAGQPSEPQTTREGTEGIERSEGRREFTIEEIGEVLAATGNSETKAILHLAMERDKPYKQGDLFTLVQEVQRGHDEKEEIRGEYLLQYCSNSLEPAGLVVATEYGYIKTEKGFDLDPLNGELLGFSEKYPKHSLQDSFSVSSAPRAKAKEGPEGEQREPTKPPLLRFRIFQQFGKQNSPTSLLDLENTLGEERSVLERHIKNLARKGFLTYESSTVQDFSQDQYTIIKLAPEGKPPPFQKYVSLTQEVYDIVKESGSIRTGEVYAKLERENQEREKPRALNMQRISLILHHLELEGYFECKPKSQFEISQTPYQRGMIGELVDIIERFQKGDDTDFLEEGRQKARDIIGNPARTAILLRKAQERSKRVGTDETRAQIRTILAEAPEEGFSNTEIQQALQDGGIDLNIKSVNRFMREMSRPGGEATIVRKERRANFYGLVQEESSAEPDEQS